MVNLLGEAVTASAEESPERLELKPIRNGKRFRELAPREQGTLFMRSVDGFVKPDNPVRALADVMDSLSYSVLERRHPGGGRPGIHPRVLCELWVYAHSRGVRSARELSRRLEMDLGFMWLAHEERIDHETLSDFRRQHGEDLKDIFRQTVELAQEMGLVKLEHVAIDGTKIAAASARDMLTGEQLDAAMARIREKYAESLAESDAVDAAEDAEFGTARGDELPEELTTAEGRLARLQEAKEELERRKLPRISVTDPEAPLMRTRDGKRPGYNCQAAVDAEVGFVVAESTTVSQNDQQEFVAMAESVVEMAGSVPAEFSADAGYCTAATLEALEAYPEWNVFMSVQRIRKNGSQRVALHHMGYCRETDTLTCPGGGVLKRLKTVVLRDGQEYVQYRSQGSRCKVCDFKPRCLSEKGRRRHILMNPGSERIAAMRQKMSTEAGQAARLKRKCTVERVFGVMKAKMGLRQFLLRGQAGAAIEFRLACITTNVMKLAAHKAAMAS